MLVLIYKYYNKNLADKPFLSFIKHVNFLFNSLNWFACKELVKQRYSVSS